MLYITPVVLSAYYLGGKYLKKAVVEALNEQLEVRVDVHSVHFSGLQSFPHLGIKFLNVRISESTPVYKQSLLSASEITLEFNPLNLLRGQNEIDRIEFNNGAARIFLGEDGQSNFEIIKSGEDGENQSDFELDLKKVVLKNFNCMYLGNEREQSVNFHTNLATFSGKFSKDRFVMKSEGDALFDHLMLDHQNYISGKYCKFDVDLEIDQKINAYHINKADIELDDLELRIDGDILMAGDIPDLDVRVQGRNMDIQSLLSLLPNDQRFALRDLQSTGLITLKGSVKGRLEDAKIPDVDVQFNLSDVGIFMPDKEFDIRHLALNGILNNTTESGQLAMSIDMSQLRMPHSDISGTFVIGDLEKPVLNYATKGKLDLRDIEGLARSEVPDLQKLFGQIRFNLVGSMDLSNDQNSILSGTKTNGDLEIDELIFAHKDHDKLEHLYLKTRILGDKLSNLEFKGELMNNQLLFKGEIDHWQTYLSSENRLNVKGSLASQNFNLNRLLGQEMDETPDTDDQSEVDLDFGIDLELKVDADIFEWDQLRTRALTGDLIWQGGSVSLSDIRFEAWSGKTEGKAYIRPTEYGYEMTAIVKAKEVSIEEFFTDFDNFGQTEFTPEILKGSLTSKMDMRISFDRFFNVIEDSIQALADLVISNGMLKNYQAMESLSAFVQLKELMEIQFETLQNTVEIKNRTVFIPQMSIRNNALNVELGGSHTFDNYMDYKLKIRVTELLAGKSGWARRKLEQQLEDEQGGGLSAYLTMTGTPEDLKIKYDVKSVKQVVGKEIKKEGKTFFRDVKKELKGESIEKTEVKKSRWLE